MRTSAPQSGGARWGIEFSQIRFCAGMFFLTRIFSQMILLPFFARCAPTMWRSFRGASPHPFLRLSLLVGEFSSDQRKFQEKSCTDLTQEVQNISTHFLQQSLFMGILSSDPREIKHCWDGKVQDVLPTEFASEDFWSDPWKFQKKSCSVVAENFMMLVLPPTDYAHVI